MRIASVNQDPGIAPAAHKGASVHLGSLRAAFTTLGAEVVAVDDPRADDVRRLLLQAHAAAPLDLVYERYALGAEEAGRFARAAGVPLVLEVNAPLLEEAAAHRGLPITAAALAQERRIFSRASVVRAVSSGVARFVQARGLPEERVIVRPNGVDLARFRPVPRAPGERRPFVLGFHGRLRPWHGFPLLVEAAAGLLARGLDLRLEIVGEGEFASHLAALPPGAWRHTPWVPHDEVPARIARFDALALTYPAGAPTYFSPLKLLEAMAVGAVPVVPAAGDLPVLVSHGDSGLVYPLGDVAALVDTLARLAQDPGLRERLGRGARIVAERHAWTEVAAEILSWLPTGMARR